jgi:diguanylate cyclase (GGDEF)-like protein
MTRPWETAEDQTLSERLFPIEEAFPDHIKLMRYRGQIAVGIALLLVVASFLIDLFQPPRNPTTVWVLRVMLLIALGISFLAARSAVISLPRLYTLTYVDYFSLSLFFALIIVFGRQAVLFTAFHTIAVGILLRPLSGLQARVSLGLVTLGALGVGLGIGDQEGWRTFIPGMLVLLGTEVIIQMVADMNFKLQVAEGEARQRMEEAMRKMNFLSSFDHLTRVMNRRNFEDAVENALLEARSAGQGLGYLEVDLDYFKEINDTYGHQAGDAVLRSASERIAACLRTGDLVGRMGGDEFAAAIRGATTDIAERVATRILESFKQTPVRTSWGDIPISCTVGIGCYSGKGATTANAIMAAADQSLYEAKEAGRGRIGRAIVVSGAEHIPTPEGMVPGVGMPSVEISAAPEHLARELDELRVGAGAAEARADETVHPENESADSDGEIKSPVPPPPHLRRGQP